MVVNTQIEAYEIKMKSDYEICELSEQLEANTTSNKRKFDEMMYTYNVFKKKDDAEAREKKENNQCQVLTEVMLNQIENDMELCLEI